MGFCGVCKQPAVTKCTKCKLVFYCSRECQKQDWKAGHKTNCQLFLPEFHEEYRRRYPEDKMPYEKVKVTYRTCKTNHLLFDDVFLEMLFRQQRWGGNSMDYVLSLLPKNPKPGDVLEFPVVPYSRQAYQTNRNTEVLNIPHTIGKTYVGVGFVDLQQLLMADFHEVTNTNNGSSTDSQPLVFVGYDTSIISVARSLIIYEMMKRKCELASILQVWYSSGWTQTTKKEFEETCSGLLTSIESTEVDAEIVHLIEFWKTAKISVKECKRQSCEEVTHPNLEPMASLENEVDRMDYAHYLFTGLIFGQKADYQFGNVTLFNLPPNLDGCVRLNGNVFQTISQANFAEFKDTLMNSVTQLFRDRLSTLVKLIEKGKVVCRFRLALLTPTSTALHHEIKALEPAAIDWSNIFDYMHKKDALKMALRCSSRNTVHNCHFMNWIRFVYGASLLDYPNREVMCETLKQKMNSFYNAAKGNTPFLRQDGYAVALINITDKALSIKMHCHFIDYFFDKEKFVTVKATHYDEFNLFAPSHTSFHLTFEFKPSAEGMYD